MIKKVVILFMKFFVKLYFKLDKVCYCFYIETKGDNDDFDIIRREYKNDQTRARSTGKSRADGVYY